MYKYMQMRPAKPQKKSKGEDDEDFEKDNDSDDPFGEDAELEKFADAEMQKQMKRMA